MASLDPLDSDLVVRTLKAGDADRLARMDRQYSGRDRKLFFERKLARALRDSDVAISLGAEHDDLLVGALLVSLHYGEFGIPEPVAILDTILVEREFTGKGVATAMLEQLVKNLGALGIETIRTEIAWDEQDLLGFLARSGFEPTTRLVLERGTARD